MLRNSEGSRLSPKDESFLLKAFGVLPNVLRSYRGGLKAEFRYPFSVFWERRSNVGSTTSTTHDAITLYEEDRLANAADAYNADRLLRLVNVGARCTKFPRLAHRAYGIWLDELEQLVLSSPHGIASGAVPARNK